MTDIFNEIDIADQASKITQHYTASIQETTEETPETVDKTPVSQSEREALDAANKPTFEPIFDNQPNERAAVFTPPGGYVSPLEKQRQIQAMSLPSFQRINDLNNRMRAVLRFDGAPEEVVIQAQAARALVGAATDAYEEARHPENKRFAVSPAAKEEVIQAIAKATIAVDDLDATANREDVREAWFNGLIAALDDQRKAAASALDKAARAYASWRQSISSADALAKEQGRFGDWHHHPEERELNPLALIGELRKARDIANSEDDFVSGAYLTIDYGNEIPPHTLKALEASAKGAPGSFAEMTFLRLKSPHTNDGPARDTIQSKDLRIINTRPVPVLNPIKRDQD